MSNSALPTIYQEFIFKKTYARYVDKESRREDWDETVDRYKKFFMERVPEGSKSAFNEAIDAIKKLEIVPSMRALWTAGEALKRDNIAGYNCAYTPIDRPKAFAELLFVLMNGTGAGYSVERQYITKLPNVPEELGKKKCETPIIFEDSKLGWAQGFYEFINELYSGCIPEYDLSKIRPKGAKLKTFGGRASGPEPLKKLLEFTKNTFINAKGRKLNSLECHDICCVIASIVVAGGVRRSAMISFSNRSDDRMGHAKDGEFWLMHPHRGYSNNSIAYTEKPSTSMFMEDWLVLMRSGSGERGIFNTEAAKFISQQNGRRDINYDLRSNPCCVPGDTLILTENGNITVNELIAMSDALPKVASYNIITKEVEWEVPTWIGPTRKDATLVELELESGEILRLTPDHRVYTENRGYVNASLLNEEDVIITTD